MTGKPAKGGGVTREKETQFQALAPLKIVFFQSNDTPLAYPHGRGSLFTFLITNFDIRTALFETTENAFY